MDKHRLKVLLFQAIQAKKAYLGAEAMLDYFVTDNEGLSISQKVYLDNVLTSFIVDKTELTDTSMQHFIDQLRLDSNPKLTPLVNPMTFEEFSKKYTEAGKYGDLTEAYAYYCSDPASHFLHKE